jgi:hypothetical protein
VLPAAFIGGWRRTELVVGGRARDDADVLWLQGAEWYADVRIPHHDRGGPVEAFAGPARWEPPRFTWEHRLDWLGSFPDDVGHLAWDGDDLIETGVFDVDGHHQPYSERWVRAGAGAPRLVAVSAGERPIVAIRVAADAIVVAAGPADGGFAVRRDVVDGGAVKARFSREEGTAPLPAFPFVHAWSIGDVVAYDGVSVEVVDVG